jgi:mRNA-degrading endonuclease YafQ of YafQ-DinJ toxin-antitoxin module
MNAKARIILCTGAAIAAIAVAPAMLVYAGDPVKDAKQAQKDAKDTAKQAQKDAKDAMPGMDPSMEKAMMEYMTPNENHQMLAKWAGEWEITTRWFMSEGAPPVENKATSTCKMVMDGRYLVEKVQGEMKMDPNAPAEKFEGMAMMGYDNHAKKFFSHWIDNMGTGCMTEWGTASADGKSITTEGENYNPMVGKMTKTKSVATLVDDNNRKLEMWGPGMDGKTMKVMEILYKRKK